MEREVKIEKDIEKYRMEDEKRETERQNLTEKKWEKNDKEMGERAKEGKKK